MRRVRLVDHALLLRLVDGLGSLEVILRRQIVIRHIVGEVFLGSWLLRQPRDAHTAPNLLLIRGLLVRFTRLPRVESILADALLRGHLVPVLRRVSARFEQLLLLFLLVVFDSIQLLIRLLSLLLIE